MKRVANILDNDKNKGIDFIVHVKNEEQLNDLISVFLGSSFPCFLGEEEQAEITSDKHAATIQTRTILLLLIIQSFIFLHKDTFLSEKRGTKKNPGVTPDSILKFTRSHYNASTTFFCSLKNIIR